MERTGFEQWKPREVARLLALVETERRYYQEMVAALPVALAVLGPDRTVVSANRAFRQLVQLSGDELRQKTIDQVLPSDELIEHIRSAHVLGGTAPFMIDIGERRYRIAAIPIRSWEEEMQPETLLMVEPREIEPAPPTPAQAPAPAPAPEQAPESVSAPALDLSSLPAVLWQADASSYVFAYVGGAAEDLLGYPDAHWLSEPLFFSERIHPEDRAEVMALYQATAASGGEASAEFRAIAASGKFVWMRESIRVPAPGVGSRVISGVMTAIGERRQLEVQALQSGRIDALRGLASRLAHDLNNPLMIVSGYTEDLLGALPEDAPSRGDMTEILAAAMRMGDLAGGLLAFTRSPTKPPAKIALTEVVSGLEGRLSEVAREVGIAFPDGAVWTFADAEQLEDAISALAAFAIENTKDASKIALTCRPARITERTATGTLAPGLYARLDILAPGNAPAPPRAVFESIPPVSPVVRAYLNVRQWGGDIMFATDPAQGSSFAVYLPYAEAPYAEPIPEEPAEELPTVIEAAEPEPEPSVPAEPEPSLGAILVVEDEPGIRGLVRKILRREHYDVLEAGNAEEALAQASEPDIHIDLLLTDVMLPGMGGRELAESLASKQPDLKVVYVSGFTDDEAVRAGQFPPGSRFLQKPFTLSALLSIVKEALDIR